MDRCYRIGQTKQVYVYRLVTKDTIEEKIIAELKPLQVETKKPQAERPHGFIPQVASWI